MTNLLAINDPAHWDSIADGYAADADRMTGLYARDTWELADVPAGARVLDVATGAGALLMAALEGGTDAIGVDFSPAMVAKARARAVPLRPGAAPEDIARVMDGQALEFRACCFDAAFSIFGVFMFPDPVAGLREMARVLRPGGLAVITVWENAGGAGPAQLFHQAARELFPDTPVPVPISRLLNAPELIEAAFVEAGLQPAGVHAITHAWETAPAEWFRHNAKLTFGWSPMWQTLTTAQQDAFAARAGELAEALPPEGIRSTALVGMARRAA